MKGDGKRGSHKTVIVLWLPLKMREILSVRTRNPGNLLLYSTSMTFVAIFSPFAYTRR